MSLISPDLSGIVDGAVGDAADWKTPMTTIINAINGNLDNDNIAVGANIAISKLESTAWSSGTPAGTGFSSKTSDTLYYKQIGKIVWCYVSIYGTSNSTGFGFTLPIAAKLSVNIGPFRSEDNTVNDFNGILTTSAGTTAVGVTHSAGGGTFTSSGVKGIEASFFYEAA